MGLIIGQALLNALMLGIIYSLIALGLTLIISIMRIINFAHGQLYMLGAFVFYLFYTQIHLNYFISILVAIVLIAALGVALERVFFHRLRGDAGGCILLSLGLAIVLESAALLVFGEDDKGIVSPFSGAFGIAGLFIGKERVAVIGISLVTILCLFLFLHKTKTGRAIRAFAQDTDAAILQGINVDQLSWIGFAIGSGLAALAGALLAPVYWLNPFIGGEAVIAALIVMVIGGLGSIPGILLGGLILGTIDSFGRQFLPGTWTQAIAYSLVVFVLIVRPQGLLGYEEK